MKQNRITLEKKVIILVLMLLVVFIYAYRAYAESWVYEKGKWYYYYTYDEPVEKQWITYGGNEYYIGSQGLMSTDKWEKDPDTGKTYYVGTNGIKQRNVYTAKGDKFVGDDGTELVTFDDWRKDAKKKLKEVIKALNKKQTVTSDQKALLAQYNASNAAFTLFDLNGDGFRDIIVINKESSDNQVLDILLWNPDEREFYAIMELDFISDESAVLKREPQYGNAWAIVTRGVNDISFWQLKLHEYNFNDVEHYHFGYNEYGDVIYYIDDGEVEAGYWNTSLMEMTRQAGSGIFTDYYDLNEASINAQVDAYPLDAELYLFQEADTD